MTRQSCSVSLTRTANQIRKAYGEFERGFCTTFNNNAKNNFPSLVDACRTHTPTMSQIDIAYGKGSALTWMVAQLAHTFAFTGLRDNISASQQIGCANAMICRRNDVTVAEFLVFLRNFEQGKYEIFKGYSHPNPQVLAASFETFLDDLYVARGNAMQIEQTIKQRREEELAKANAVPCPPEIAERIRKFNLPIKTDNYDSDTNTQE